MKNKTSRSILVLFLMIVTIFFSFGAFLTGAISFGVTDFAVDASGRIYVGKTYKVDVYENGEISHTIPASIYGKEYAFSIDPEDTFILSTYGRIHEMDLQGNVQRTYNDPAYRVHSKLKSDNTVFISATGDCYKLLNTLGYYRISKNDAEIVYSMPVFDYVMLLTLITSWIVVVVIIVRYGERWKAIFNF